MDITIVGVSLQLQKLTPLLVFTRAEHIVQYAIEVDFADAIRIVTMFHAKVNIEPKSMEYVSAIAQKYPRKILSLQLIPGEGNVPMVQIETKILFFSVFHTISLAQGVALSLYYDMPLAIKQEYLDAIMEAPLVVEEGYSHVVPLLQSEVEPRYGSMGLNTQLLFGMEPETLLRM